ncbi:MAG: cytochrome P450 [Candidatus Velthaea sp.]
MNAQARLSPPPGPQGLDVLRFFGGGSFAKTLAYFEDVTRTYGPIASFRVLGRRLHLVTGPELVREVLVVQQVRFTRANGAAVLRDLLGKSMLTVDEPRHREQRRVLQPAFHAARIASYGAAMLDETYRTVAAWQPGEPIDVNAEMTQLALAIVGRALFGADMRGNAGALEASLSRAMRTVSWLGPILEALPQRANRLRLSLPLPANARLAQARHDMTEVVERLIAVRRASGAKGEDLLSLLLEARDADGEPLSPQLVADELVTLFLAGHETTANALAWAWYLLARHPEIEARLHAEVAGAIGGRDSLTVEDLPRLRYAAHVFAEVLRLYPPASAFGRRALEACALGGFAIRPGDGILLSPYVSHRNPAVFSEPEAFVPDRWAGAAPPPFAYFPFGGGARTCIGEAFARMEGTLVLSAVSARFSLQAATAEPIGIAGYATLRPGRPIVLCPRRRA